jgi:hypothetical protein
MLKPKREDKRGEWRRLHNEELNVCISPYVIRANKSRIRRAGNSARMGELHAGFCWGSLRERDHLEDIGVDAKIILRRISRRWDGGHGLNWLSIGQVAGSCECGNEPSDSRKCGEFFYWLRTGYLLKKDSAPWIN